MSLPSLLETVADHEQGLMRDIASAEDESRRQLEQAQTQATALAQESFAKLDTEIADRRRASAAERESTRQTIERTTAEQVATIRQQTADRLDEVRERILQMVLPRA